MFLSTCERYAHGLSRPLYQNHASSAAVMTLGDEDPTDGLGVAQRRPFKNRLTIHHIMPERRSLDTARQTDDCDAVLMRIALA